ncbi:hypothetical protein IW261DRAFT_265442 [Armillaria novae-zelandiae]|uniref:Smr domain-containing protein n=1 Tax=Armillaria novae-zelandiae TaxID=153914 RepID=A0AA39P4S2_9AGAR|nr:hypothetical protein IW261DRAFT_265442 [Armillaria novae-zelandiae]
MPVLNSLKRVFEVALSLMVAYEIYEGLRGSQESSSGSEPYTPPVHRPQQRRPVFKPRPHRPPSSQSDQSAPCTPPAHKPEQYQLVSQPPPRPPSSQSDQSTPCTSPAHKPEQHQLVSPPPRPPSSQSDQSAPCTPPAHKPEQHQLVSQPPPRPPSSQSYQSAPCTPPAHKPEQHQLVSPPPRPPSSQSDQSAPCTPPAHKPEQHQLVSPPPRPPSSQSDQSAPCTPPAHKPEQHQLVSRPPPRPPSSQSCRPSPHQPSSAHEPPKHEDDTQEDQPNEHHLFLRARANREGDEMERCFNESHEAYHRGDRAAAKDFSKQGKIHKQKMELLNTEASDWIYYENNRDCRPGEIDLHHLRVKEAIARTDAAIEEATRRGDSKLRIIVGKGLHSEGGEARVRPAIKALMRKHQLVTEFDPSNSGVLIVKLDASHPNRQQQRSSGRKRRANKIRA